MTKIVADPGTEGYIKFGRARLAQLTAMRKDLRLPIMNKHWQIDAATRVDVRSSEFGDMIRVTGGRNFFVWGHYYSADGNQPPLLHIMNRKFKKAERFVVPMGTFTFPIASRGWWLSTSSDGSKGILWSPDLGTSEDLLLVASNFNNKAPVGVPVTFSLGMATPSGVAGSAVANGPATKLITVSPSGSTLAADACRLFVCDMATGLVTAQALPISAPSVKDGPYAFIGVADRSEFAAVGVLSQTTFEAYVMVVDPNNAWTKLPLFFGNGVDNLPLLIATRPCGDGSVVFSAAFVYTSAASTSYRVYQNSTLVYQLDDALNPVYMPTNSPGVVIVANKTGSLAAISRNTRSGAAVFTSDVTIIEDGVASQLISTTGPEYPQYIVRGVSDNKKTVSVVQMDSAAQATQLFFSKQADATWVMTSLSTDFAYAYATDGAANPSGAGYMQTGLDLSTFSFTFHTFKNGTDGIADENCSALSDDLDLFVDPLTYDGVFAFQPFPQSI